MIRQIRQNFSPPKYLAVRYVIFYVILCLHWEITAQLGMTQHAFSNVYIGNLSGVMLGWLAT